MGTDSDQSTLPSALRIGLAIGAAIVAWIVVSTILGFLFTLVKFALVLGAVAGVIWLTNKGSD